MRITSPSHILSIYPHLIVLYYAIAAHFSMISWECFCLQYFECKRAKSPQLVDSTVITRFSCACAPQVFFETRFFLCGRYDCFCFFVSVHCMSTSQRSEALGRIPCCSDSDAFFCKSMFFFVPTGSVILAAQVAVRGIARAVGSTLLATRFLCAIPFFSGNEVWL